MRIPNVDRGLLCCVCANHRCQFTSLSLLHNARGVYNVGISPATGIWDMEIVEKARVSFAIQYAKT